MHASFRPIQLLIWRNPTARARRLLRFAAVEADGGSDLVRAAELTSDPVLRRLFFAHAADERRHAGMFRARGLRLLAEQISNGSEKPRDHDTGFDAAWLTPGERGLDDVRVDEHDDATLLAFLHLSESTAARDFAQYRAALGCDAATQAVFDKVLRDEVFHMNYTAVQLSRVATDHSRRLLWQARLSRLWKAFVRLMAALAGVLGTVMMLLQYFIVLPPFALLARRAARRAQAGWQTIKPASKESMRGQY